MGSENASIRWASGVRTQGLSLPLCLGACRSGVVLERHIRRNPEQDRTMRSRETYQEASDSALMAWSGEGDRRAFDQIVSRHGRLALRVARRLISDPSMAEDLAQEGMMRAWTQATRFDPSRATVSTWIYRIVTNLCIDHSRRRRWEAVPEGVDMADPAPATDEALHTAQRASALIGALRGLSVRHRTAITLVYDEGLSGVETARVLGVTAKTVERLLASARTLLRTRLMSHDER